MGKRTYRAIDFHRVDWTDLARRVEGGRAVFAIDAAKKDFVGVLRKLTRALWHVGQGECFDETRLFADARA